VRELSQIDWTDGLWICAHVTVTDPPCWLDKRTAASFARITVHAPPMGEDAYRVTRALVKEVSIVSPDRRPREPLAHVLWIGESTSSSPAAERSDRRPAAGEVILGGERIVCRHNTGKVLAVGGRPLRTSSGYPIRREGHDYIVDQPDGSQVIYSGADAYREALYDGQASSPRCREGAIVELQPQTSAIHVPRRDGQAGARLRARASASRERRLPQPRGPGVRSHGGSGREYETRKTRRSPVCTGLLRTTAA
jgi:hypothetical protein